MGEVSASALSSLPVQSNPAYAVKAALDKLQSSIGRSEKALAPSFLKRLLGGVSRDNARAVVAASLEDTRVIRSVMSEARIVAIHTDAKALLGSVDRVVKAIDQWRETALEFDSAVYGSDDRLLQRTRKLATLCTDLRNPAAGLV